MNTRIEIPAELRQQIVDARANFEKAGAAHRQARAAGAAEIARHEATVAELRAAGEVLKREAVESNESAALLMQNERREGLIAEEVARLKAARAAAPGIDYREINDVLDRIGHYWNWAVKESFFAAVAPFGLAAQHVRLLMAQAEAFQILRIISDRNLYGRSGFNSNTIFSYFDRALVGNINLNAPVPAPATAGTAVESSAVPA